MIRSALALTLGLASLTYGQEGNVVRFNDSDCTSCQEQVYGSPNDLYTQVCRNPFGTLNLLSSSGKIYGDTSLDNSLSYKALVPTSSSPVRCECAIDSEGRIIYEDLYNPANALIIDDEVYERAIVLTDNGSFFPLEYTTIVAQTGEGRIVLKSLGDPTDCTFEIPENFVSNRFSATRYVAEQSLRSAIASIDQSGQIHVWTDCSEDELITNPPSLADFIDVKIGKFGDSPLTGVALTESGDVYMWGSLEQPTIIDSGIQSISVGTSESRPFFGLSKGGSVVAWDTLGSNALLSPTSPIISLVDYEDQLAIVNKTHSVYEATPETITTVLNSAASFDQITLGIGEYDFSAVEFDGKRFAFNGTNLETTVRLSSDLSQLQGSLANCSVIVDLSDTPSDLNSFEFINCKFLTENQLQSTRFLFGTSAIIFRDCDFSDIQWNPKQTVSSGGVYLVIDNCNLGGCSFYYDGNSSSQTVVPPYSVSINNCSFEDRSFQSPYESVITCDGSNISYLDLTGTSFKNNSAARGGAICLRPFTAGNCRIINGEFDSNNAVFGGAIYASAYSVKISGSNFIGNSSTNGGSIYISGASFNPVAFSDCSFVAQQSNDSEITVIDSDVQLEKSLFSGSPPEGYAEIMTTSKSLIFARNNTFCANISNFDGLSVVDLGGNVFQDSCDQVDCNSNGQIDSEEIESGSAVDCDFNGILDSCELATNPSLDCDQSGTLDSCDVENGTLNDCNQNQIGDACEIAANPSLDANDDGVIDSCQCITDINQDGVTDFTDIVQLLSCWEQEVDGVCAFADVDQDDAIGFGDLLLVLSGFGPC
jgi:hypothetical protein